MEIGDIIFFGGHPISVKQYPVVSVDTVYLNIGRVGSDVAVSDTFVCTARVLATEVDHALMVRNDMTVPEFYSVLVYAADIIITYFPYLCVEIMVLRPEIFSCLGNVLKKILRALFGDLVRPRVIVAHTRSAIRICLEAILYPHAAVASHKYLNARKQGRK